MAMVSPVLPLIGGGTRGSSRHVGDLGQAVAQAVWDRSAAVFDYELGGPGVYSFEALMKLSAAEIHAAAFCCPIPLSAARCWAGGDLIA